MSTEKAGTTSSEDEIPRAQKLFDNWWLLLIAGIAIMAVIYTGWGFWEVLTMPKATLP